MTGVSDGGVVRASATAAWYRSQRQRCISFWRASCDGGVDIGDMTGVGGGGGGVVRASAVRCSTFPGTLSISLLLGTVATNTPAATRYTAVTRC